MATYEKPTDYWYVNSMRGLDNKVIEPVGFCEFCDKNNKVWYTPMSPCHITEELKKVKDMTIEEWESYIKLKHNWTDEEFKAQVKDAFK